MEFKKGRKKYKKKKLRRDNAMTSMTLLFVLSCYNPDPDGP